MTLTATGKKKKQALMTKRHNALKKVNKAHDKATKKRNAARKKIEDKYHSGVSKVHKKHTKKRKKR